MRWWHKLALSAFLSIAIITVLMFANFRGSWTNTPTNVNLPDLPKPVERLLIVAPHCDDETLSSAGLIMESLRKGVEVRVLIATNGDGYRFATMQEFHSLFPSYKDFIDMGKLRQQESLNALRLLGVGADKVYFLGYPDRGTPTLWNDHWDKSDPYRSPYDNATKSPYPITYNHKSVYSGEDMLSDIESVLRTYKPDLVVYPHSGDAHPDHWGVGLFTRLALTLTKESHPDFRPREYTYLVHRQGFPTPQGLFPQKGLLPPASLAKPPASWFRVELSQNDALTKWEAIRAYHSQIPLMRKFMESFVRRNELFGVLPALKLPKMASGVAYDATTWKDAGGKTIEPVQKDVTSDMIAQDAVGAARLVSLYAAEREPGKLVVSARLLGKTRKSLTYTLRIMGISKHGVTHYVSTYGRARKAQKHASGSGNFVYDTVPMSELGNPSLIFVRAEVRSRGLGVMGFSTWQMLRR